MKLTKSQKNQIYNKTMIIDDYEWVPCINHVLKVLGYEDILEHDENYETVKWSVTEPLIKDEKIRKAVRAWAEANDIDPKYYYETYVKFDFVEHQFKWINTSIEFNDITGLENLEGGKIYTIAKLCGESEE